MFCFFRNGFWSLLLAGKKSRREESNAPLSLWTTTVCGLAGGGGAGQLRGWGGGKKKPAAQWGPAHTEVKRNWGGEKWLRTLLQIVREQ